MLAKEVTEAAKTIRVVSCNTEDRLKCHLNSPTICANTDDKERAGAKKRGQKTNAERLTADRARASSIGAIKELLKSRKRSLERSWDKTLTDLSIEKKPAKKVAKYCLEEQTNTSKDNSTLSLSPPVPVANSSLITDMNGEQANKIFEELALTRELNASRFDSLEKSIQAQTDQLKKEQQASMSKIQEELKERDKVWKEEWAKMESEVKDLKARVDMPKEQITLKITEEMEKRVVEKVHQSAIETNPFIVQMENSLKYVMRVLDRDEKLAKKRNITMSGLETVPNLPLIQQANEFLNARFAVSNPVENAFLVGGEKKIVKVVLCDFKYKDLIMKEKKNVLGGTKIYINPDLTSCEAKVAKHLREAAKAHRNGGGSARIAGRKIQLGDEWWEWDDTQQKLTLIVDISKIPANRKSTPPRTNRINSKSVSFDAAKNGADPPQVSSVGMPGGSQTFCPMES